MDAHTSIAVIADIHGNSWALDAVLADIRRRNIALTINLGDSVYGPLDPAGTAERLIQWGTINVRGNSDRVLVEPTDPARASPTLDFAIGQLRAAHRKWLQEHMPTYVHGDVLCCHGGPTSDEMCLLEDVSPMRVSLAATETIAARVESVQQRVVLCAHTHIPRIVWLPTGRLLMNPGSVGVPAFAETSPYPQIWETGSPYARYAILSRQGDGYAVDHIAVPYPWDEAAAVARQNGRADWAAWIETGRATLPQPRL